MRNPKTRDFIKTLNANGFHAKTNCGKGSHQVYERTQTISVPISGTEINGALAAKLVKEFNLV